MLQYALLLGIYTAIHRLLQQLYCAVYIVAGQSHTCTLWAATNAGVVYIYQLTVPTADKREEDIVQCILGLYLSFCSLILEQRTVDSRCTVEC